MSQGKVKQSIPKPLRLTLQQFADKFPDDEACLEYLKEKRYPGGVSFCDKCQKERKHHRVSGRPAYTCDYCGKMISPMAGTIFEQSSTSLRIWFYAMYLMGSTRCGISAQQIQRETGVTYKTAWRIFRQIRSLLSEPDMQLEGPTVKVDETYFGGVRKYSRGRPMRGDKQKTPIVAIVQRKGEVVAKAVPDVYGGTLLGMVRKHVIPGSTIYTDELHAYRGIPFLWTEHRTRANFQHYTIKHSQAYVRGHVRTNTVEGFWSLVKRGIGGVYHQVSPKYVQSYLDEYSFRYNRRFEGNQQFNAILERAS
ncbi:MAG TPA: IS1595 family transposase [Candidatus Dormibacteraeota bacterium]|nr:IS1595 family transposase [Candidatus Dormibacteraeota bacterium]